MYLARRAHLLRFLSLLKNTPPEYRDAFSLFLT